MNLRACNLAVMVCLLVGISVGQSAASKSATDHSGRYSFLQDGEDVQLNQSGTTIDGYVTRLGTSDSDRDSVLEHVFTKASLDGDKLSFSTKPVHAVWYEFKGRIERGAAKTRAEDGYYQIVGTLTEHTQKDGKEAGARSRQVTLKLFADEAEAPRK